MTQFNNKTIVEDIYKQLAAGNVQAVLSYLADDFEFMLMGRTTLSGTYKGKAAFVTRLWEPLAKRLSGPPVIIIDRLIAEGDWVAAQSHGYAHTARGTAYNNLYCQIFHFRYGKVMELTEYLDTALLSEVLDDSVRQA